MNWKKVTIGDLVEDGTIELQTGPFGTQLKASDYVSDGTPVINVRNIGYRVLNPEKLEYIPENVLNRLSRHILIPGDIVFGRKGAVDRHLLVTSLQNEWLQGSDCIRMRIFSDKINPDFISYSFLLDSHKNWMLIQCGNKATMASLNQDVIKRIQLNLPDNVTQRAIVDILSKYDDLIENNRRRIQLLEEAARLLYQEWFVRLRFPGHEHTKIVDGVPEGWRKKTLGETTVLNYGKALKEENRIPGPIPVFGSSGIVGYHEKPLVEGPGIIIGRKGNVGSVFWADSDFHPIDTVYYVNKEETSFFLYYALSNISFVNTDVAVPGLNRTYAYSRTIIWPNATIMEMFDSFITPIHTQISLLNKNIDSVVKARDLLLPRLMNGVIPV
ncbi:MAG: restriction endonuclease subunit S [Methanospirillaceae archaeon]|nr:restriction endonuclease subunit S [Methanospirillaceae archaeon]